MDIIAKLCDEFNIKKENMTNVVNLIDEGNTIPFIARYRKEMTGHLDDQVLREVYDRLNYLRNLEKRKEEVSSSITEQEKMTDEIKNALLNAVTLTEVEDIYRPYKPKKKTRATVAVAKGLQGLADIMLAQDESIKSVEEVAKAYVNEEKEVKNVDEAIAGAKDIIAEAVSDNAELRKLLRKVMLNNGFVSAKLVKKDEEGAKTYEMYDEFSEPVVEIKGHRILAINRGEKEGFLKVTIDTNDDVMVRFCERSFIKNDSVFKPHLESAVKDGYQRLIKPSLEREVRNQLTSIANEGAIKVFDTNLRSLLLIPPIKNKVTLGLDPAYRTGCKIAVVDGTGKVLDTTVIYPTPPQSKIEEAKEVLKKLIAKHKVDIISIGNGTASKESEIFVAELIKEVDRKVSYMVVNEAGASVYSASKLAAKEFPDFDVSLRSAVSIARRLQDPLSELIKIDPKSIGVGQYQHDVPQNELDSALQGVLESCVNSVGVDLNTASEKLLSFVSGLSSAVAKNIVDYREKNGKFSNRSQLLKVNKLGDKAYKQCAGFLRIMDGDNILDNTAVHPESYEGAEKLLKKFGYTSTDVKESKLHELTSKINAQGVDKVASEIGVGVDTLNDIVVELLKPGRDIRDSLPQPMLRSDLMDIKDLKEGMIIKGTVRNVVDFGAFVDIGVHQDGLVHISELSDKFVKKPEDVVKVGQVVDVKVIGVDLRKNKISLSMKGLNGETQTA